MIASMEYRINRKVKRRQGAALQARFHAAGLPALIRQQDSDGLFIATFFQSECAAETDSAVVWAAKIRAAFPTAEIVDTRDTIASWRRVDYVLFASVEFTLIEDTRHE